MTWGWAAPTAFHRLWQPSPKASDTGQTPSCYLLFTLAGEINRSSDTPTPGTGPCGGGARSRPRPPARRRRAARLRGYAGNRAVLLDESVAATPPVCRGLITDRGLQNSLRKWIVAEAQALEARGEPNERGAARSQNRPYAHRAQADRSAGNKPGADLLLTSPPARVHRRTTSL